MPLEIRPSDPGHPSVAQIVAAHIAHGEAHYPTESNHHLDIDDYGEVGVTLFAAWDGDLCVGTAGLKALDTDNGEVKSMHVPEGSRGRGIGKALLDRVLEEARNRGFRRLWLETGSREASAAARRLYERAGFAYCAPFPPYRPDPESVFMALQLGSGQRPAPA